MMGQRAETMRSPTDEPTHAWEMCVDISRLYQIPSYYIRDGIKMIAIMHDVYGT